MRKERRTLTLPSLRSARQISVRKPGEAETAVYGGSLHYFRAACDGIQGTPYAVENRRGFQATEPTEFEVGIFWEGPGAVLCVSPKLLSLGWLR
jgi:hypothetical protein